MTDEEMSFEIDMEKLEDGEMISLLKLLEKIEFDSIKNILEEKVQEILESNNINDKNKIYEFSLTKKAFKFKENNKKIINEFYENDYMNETKKEFTRQKLFTFNTIKHPKIEYFFKHTNKGLHSHHIRKAIEHYVDNQIE